MGRERARAAHRRYGFVPRWTTRGTGTRRQQMTFRGTVRGKTIELTGSLPYPDGQEVTIHVSPANGALAGSPEALLAAIHKAPPVDPAIVDELERAIYAG